MSPEKVSVGSHRVSRMIHLTERNRWPSVRDARSPFVPFKTISLRRLDRYSFAAEHLVIALCGRLRRRNEPLDRFGERIQRVAARERFDCGPRRHAGGRKRRVCTLGRRHRSATAADVDARSARRKNPKSDLRERRAGRLEPLVVDSHGISGRSRARSRAPSRLE